jgi:hypothetical protein
VAPDLVVFDHLPDSEWIFYGAEHRFRDHDELLAKVSEQGATAIQCVRHFASAALL